MHTTEQLNAALTGRYVVDRLVGEGGMATVYLARDLKHDRQVALKVLKPELGAVLGVERFLSEIKVTANLQHPNLLPLFDSGAADGLLFYVMPFVAGETLRARLDREKQLPIDEAIRLAIAIAGALDYAHRHGVIHRDLKPENILLHDGQPVVADFGIALAVSNAGGARVTQTGLSLGTPHYMSPEQAAGDRAIDARSDIYSLAAVTYEMIAGEAPHTGTTAQAVMAKLMTVDPALLSTLRKSSPVHVEAAVERALSKLPADRFSTAKEFAEALEGRGFVLAHGTRGTRAAGQPAVRRPLVAVLAVLAAVAVVATGVAAYAWSGMRREQPDLIVRFTIEVPATALTANISVGNNMAVSPDGNTIVYVGADESGRTQLFVRPLDEMAPRPLAGTSGAQQPIFSPDGKWISYQLGSAVWKVALTGDAPISLNGSVPTSTGSSWSPSGVIVSAGAGGIVIIPAKGGAAKPLQTTRLADGETQLLSPFALADGEHVLVTVFGAGGNLSGRLACVSLKTGEVTKYELSVVSAIGVSNDVLVYVTPTGALQAVGFDEKSLRLTGEPVALGTTVAVTQSGTGAVALSPTGTLIYGSSALESQVGWVSETGLFAPIITELKPYVNPRLAPDGKRIVLTAGTGARSDIWIYDLASKTPQRMTTEGTMNERAEWTPDGKRVVYRSDRGKRSGIWWQMADRSAPATSILSHDAHDYFEGVLSPDGKLLVYQVDDGTASSADLFVRALEGDTTQKVVSATNSVEAQARVSPDGKWVAFVTDASGTAQVLVQPFPNGGAQVQVSVTAGTEPIWSRDGKKIFYRDGVKMIAASVAAGTTFSVTARTPLFTDTYAFAPSPHANFDVSQDGSQFLMVKNATTSKIVVVHGWFSEMRTRLAGRK